MRTALSVVFSILILALVICVLSAMRSKRSIGKNVANLIVGLIIPIFGNLIIIITSDQILANVGYDIYFLGMDASVISLLFFAHVPFPYYYAHRVCATMDRIRKAHDARHGSAFSVLQS